MGNKEQMFSFLFWGILLNGGILGDFSMGVSRVSGGKWGDVLIGGKRGLDWGYFGLKERKKLQDSMWKILHA